MLENAFYELLRNRKPNIGYCPHLGQGVYLGMEVCLVKRSYERWFFYPRMDWGRM